MEEVLIQDGAKVGNEPDAHTGALAEVGCYSDRENKTLMEDIDAVRERVARDREERERLEKEREELEKEEEERKKKEKKKKDDEAFGKIFRVTTAGFIDPELGQKEMRKIEQEEKEKAEREAEED